MRPLCLACESRRRRAARRDARAAGQKVTADQYPYTASSTSLSATVIPDEVRSWTKLKAALADGGVARQALLIPEVVDLDGDEAAALAEAAPELEKLGLALEIERH